MNRMLELCESSVILLMVGKNLKIDCKGVKARSALPEGFKSRILEHCLHGDNGVAVAERIFLGRVGDFFIDDDNVFGERDSGAQEVVETVYRSEHPINLRRTIEVEITSMGL